MNFPKFLFYLFLLSFVSCKKKETNALPLDINLKIAESLYYAKKHNHAYAYYNKSFNFNLENENKKRASYCLLQMANIENSESDYINSEITVTKAIALFNEDTDISYQTNALNVLGQNYTQLSNYEEALKVYDQVISINPDGLTKCITKNNIAYVYSKMEKYKEAIDVLSQIENNKILLENPLDYARVLHNKGYYLHKIKNEKALEYLTRALKIREKHYDDFQIVSSYMRLAIFYENSNPKEAYKWAQKAYVSATRASIPDDRLEALDLLYKNAESLHLKDKHYMDFFRINDSLNKSRQKAKNQFAKIRFDTEKEIKKRNEYKAKMYVYIVLLLFTILVFFLIYRFTIRKNRKKIKETAYQTETRIAKKLHDELANDVHNTIAFAETQNLENRLNKDTLLENLETIYNRTRNISNENKDIDTGELYLEKLKAMLATYNSSDRNVIVNVDAFNHLKTSKEVKVVVHRVLQELMVNMKKHSQCSLASISIKSNKKFLQINYSDNGIGTDNLLNLKNGLQNAENRILSVNGTINFDTAPDKGFKVKIEIPK
ncbi:MAG TPA: tetratricopeptide repeat protein [Flavobacterium sp.]|uniref:tetratricopeptide repeat-containing sensor histidine kinase n=1 Tax=Flavobacterium sp. TaxID=239 RepID=UPI002B4B6920|nr:tetratricopeptide repeat protein [Flavobacterium sp.]HLO73038.1 tetratricopeptide repeat protein [Flavobacterium sp.]